MKKKKGLVLRRLGKESMIVAESLDLIDFDRLVSLNESAEYVWKSLPQTDFDATTVVKLLTDRYDVEEYIACKDAQDLLNLWKEAEIIEE